MNTELLNILKQIVADQGDSILADPRRVSAFLADLARDVPKPPKTALIKCLEQGSVQILKNAPEPERADRKQKLAQKLHDEEGLDLGLCGETLELLAAVLFEEKHEKEQEKISCKSCGKELQEEWKACPFCGTLVNKLPISSSVLSSSSGYAGYGIRLIKPKTNSSELIRTVENDFISINGGTFIMGSPTNEPERGSETQHQVTLSPFCMGKYPVTQKEYQDVMGTNPSKFNGQNLPVEQVSWYDAIEYCNRRSQKEKLTPAYTINGTDVIWNRDANGYRLPTEAEWEYACRAGTTTPFSTGSNITTGQANYNGNYPYNNNAKGEYRGKTTPVGSFNPNPWGLYDMHGNVDEWCWDWYGRMHEYGYPSGAQVDPTGAVSSDVSGGYQVIRGGSWHVKGYCLRSADRGHYYSSARNDNIGFRLVRG